MLAIVKHYAGLSHGDYNEHNNLFSSWPLSYAFNYTHVVLCARSQHAPNEYLVKYARMQNRDLTLSKFSTPWREKEQGAKGYG